MGSKKVQVPRVVVHTNPPKRGLLLLLTVIALVLVAALAYRYGRLHAPGGGTSSAAAGEQARVSALEAQRDALQQQVASLQRELRVRQASGARTDASANRDPAEPVPPTPTPTPTPTPAPKPPVAAVGTPVADNRLRLQDMRVSEAAGERGYRLRFNVVHGGDPEAQVVGTIWIAVNGLIDGDPVRLPLEKVSPDGGAFVKMNFRRRQEVEVALRLPTAFVARNIAVEAKPYDQKFRQAVARLDWRSEP